MTLAPELALRLGAALGEGPVWSADEGALWFVDIKAGDIHRFDPATGACRSVHVGGQPSFIALAEDGGHVVGSRSTLHRFDGERLSPPLLTLEQPEHNRTNDGTVDARGRLWFGTMDDRESEATGTVYCYGRDGLAATGLAAVVTNGPAVSEDGALLYHVDSADRTVWRYRVAGPGRLAEGEPFVRLAPDEGYPDGVVLDSEGCLWVALWDGWGVRRYSSEGALLLHVPLPCARVTKLAFGGADLRTAFVTTARIGLSADELADQPLAGSLFRFATPVAGLPANKARLPAA